MGKSQSIADLFQAFSEGGVSPCEVLHAQFKAIDNHDPIYHAFVMKDRAAAMANAEESAKRYAQKAPLSPLDGMSFTVKDLYDVVGYETRHGAAYTSAEVAVRSAPIVERLLALGAIFIGKTTTPEWGHKGVTSNPITGLITSNPYDVTKTAGGSSGGAGVAAALSLGTIHLGSDAGGSVRIPASFCGVYGFKPSPFTLPTDSHLFAPLSSLGFLSKHVGDLPLLTTLLAEKHPRDPYQKGLMPSAEVLKPRVAYIAELSGVKLAPSIQKAFQEVIKKYPDAASLRLDIPELIPCFNAHWMALAVYLVESFPEHYQAKMDPRLLEWYGMGKNMRARDYVAAVDARLTLGAYFADLFQQYDFILSPTTAMTAFDVGSNMPFYADGTPWLDWTPYTYIANLCQLPAISVPMGFDEKGLPMGLQVMAGTGRDLALLAFAQTL
jgi:aspartyl-tRNA(Asn)/glutamyl-tRNA(Gln) amidotransferase subunit A